jgi:hypothetical protein
MLTPAQAFAIASQWGSLIRSGDPGAVFYTFPLNDARPLSEDHRRQCVAYCESLLDGPPRYETHNDIMDRAELCALLDFFKESPLGDGTEKPIAPNEYQLPIDGAVGAYDQLDDFTKGYIEALFFTETEPGTTRDDMEDDPVVWEHDVYEGRIKGIPGDFGIADLHLDALEAIKADCREFQIKCGGDLCQIRPEGYTATMAGHDFWLTRNGHGAGFWDRGLGRYGDRLTAAAKAFGEVDVYLDDDGKVNLS